MNTDGTRTQGRRGRGGYARDRCDALRIDRPARLGAVEVHDVQPGGPVGMELACLLGRIVLVRDLAVVSALNQTDDLPVPQVDRGDNVHWFPS